MPLEKYGDGLHCVLCGRLGDGYAGADGVAEKVVIWDKFPEVTTSVSIKKGDLVCLRHVARTADGAYVPFIDLVDSYGA